MSKTQPSYQHSLPTHGPEAAGRGDARGPALGPQASPSRPRGSEGTPEKEVVALDETPAGHRWPAFPPAQRPRCKEGPKVRGQARLRVQSGASAQGTR